jgi:outer membrane protein OmpA-like peptidoglycan-associated protein
MRRAAGLLVAMGLATIAILVLLAFGVRTVQGDIDERVLDALSEAGLDDVVVDVDGRDVQLLGVPAAQADSIRDLIGDLRGVRRLEIVGAGTDDAPAATDADETEAAPTPEPTPTPAATDPPATEVEPSPSAEGSGGVQGPLGDPDTAATLADIAGARIGFASGSAALSTDATAQIDDLARLMAKGQDLSVTVNGGSAAGESPALAAERADAVIAALEAAGVDPDRLALSDGNSGSAIVTFVPRVGGPS